MFGPKLKSIMEGWKNGMKDVVMYKICQILLGLSDQGHLNEKTMWHLLNTYNIVTSSTFARQ
jgi:hypothetical protein